jgi:hypothetical protein
MILDSQKGLSYTPSPLYPPYRVSRVSHRLIFQGKPRFSGCHKIAFRDTLKLGTLH